MIDEDEVPVIPTVDTLAATTRVSDISCSPAIQQRPRRCSGVRPSRSRSQSHRTHSTGHETSAPRHEPLLPAGTVEATAARQLPWRVRPRRVLAGAAPDFRRTARPVITLPPTILLKTEYSCALLSLLPAFVSPSPYRRSSRAEVAPQARLHRQTRRHRLTKASRARLTTASRPTTSRQALRTRRGLHRARLSLRPPTPRRLETRSSCCENQTLPRMRAALILLRSNQVPLTPP